MQKFELFNFSKKDAIFLKPMNLGQCYVTIVGPLGKISRFFKFGHNCVQRNNSLFFSEKKLHYSFVGFLNATLLGLIRGFYFEFIIRGIGFKYRYFKKNNEYSLLFKLGYGHKIFFKLNDLVFFKNNKRFDFLISGFDKGLVRNFAESIRNIKETDSYKGKGIKYYRVPLKLKVGKVR
jgi:ribosomal protein L6P/L9E